MRGILEPEHLLLILLVVLVMFGGKKIPELAGGLGKGVREFKKGLNDPGTPDALAVPPAAATPPAAASTTAPATPAHDGPKRLLG